MKIKEIEINSPEELKLLPMFLAIDLATEQLNKGIDEYTKSDLDLIVNCTITHELSFPFFRAMAKSLYKDDKDKCLAVNDFISMMEDKYRRFKEQME